ncbi:hypothetical protein [Sporosarcina sp. A2]|uniref:hypothetical protein n=1 Tax=Sporosarcina sp. A2 TaxID=3393449 RepID=UPI003D7A270A
MIKTRLSWRCSICEKSSKNAGSLAVFEWFLLFGGAMSNQQLRKFLHLTNGHTAYRILQKFEFDKTGGSKNRKYLHTPYRDKSSIL